MNFELCTDLLLQRLLGRLDPARRGVCIEIGLGGRDFSFRWARADGFRCIAVEPLPTLELARACQEQAVTLVVAAVTASGGAPVPIYLGRVGDHDLPDTSSLHPDWWGCGRESRLVDSISLSEIFVRHAVSACSLLKVDTEGSERPILESIAGLAPDLRPAVVAFEYGGGGRRADRTGAWAPEFLPHLLAAVSALQSLGYRFAIVAESSESVPRRAVLDGDPGALFPHSSEVGNLILTREDVPAEVFAAWGRELAPALASADRAARRAFRQQWLRHQRVRFAAGLKRRFRRLFRLTPESSA